MFKLSDAGLEFVKKELSRYETKESAIIPSLFKAQEENGGWVSPEVIAYLSEVMGIPASQIDEVATFYSMFNKKPVGKHHVQVCNNLTCCMLGARELTDALLKENKVKEGDVSADGRVTVSRVECLGSCDTAPMMQIGDRYYENLTVDGALKIVRELK